MEEATEPIKLLYRLHEIHTKDPAGTRLRYSEEEKFWFGFAVTSCYFWDPKAQIEIRLSEIFRLYLTIYCEKIDSNMKVEDEAIFVKLLKEKYEQIRQVAFEGDRESSKKLGEIVHKEKLNILKEALTASGVLTYALSTVPMPFRLINDV
jgi:hypothetical protein